MFYIFRSCSKLESITLPASVTSVGSQAFRDCSMLTEVNIFAPSLTTYGTDAFRDTHADLKIYVPFASVDTYKSGWSTYADKIQAITYDFALTVEAENNLHGSVAFFIGDMETTSANEGDEVTVTVVPDEGYVVDAISAEAYTSWESARRRSPAPNNIPILGDIALTPVEGVDNAWTFTMPVANVEVTVRYAKAYDINVRAGGFATFYTDENVKLDAKTPEGVTLHTITSVTETEAVVGTPLEGIVAADTPLLVYNDTEADEEVRIVCTAEDATAAVTWADEFKGTAEGKTFTADDMQAADFYALSGSKVFVKVPGAGTLAAHKCWLQIDKQNGPGARQINIVFGEETGISEEVIVKSEESAPATYTIDGRKVTAPTKKGVYIQNGRKVVIK